MVFSDEKYIDLLGLKVPVTAIEVMRDLRDRIEAIERTRDALLASSLRYSKLLRQRNRELLKARRRIEELEAPQNGWKQYAARIKALPGANRENV